MGRYGGDEFIVLLRETDEAQAQALVASLTPLVVETDGGQSLILGYSAGISAITNPAIQSVDDWIRFADKQMYNQKLQRRGR
jgi:diguanylate cyclase (GGDEF)-like protein